MYPFILLVPALLTPQRHQTEARVVLARNPGMLSRFELSPMPLTNLFARSGRAGVWYDIYDLFGLVWRAVYAALPYLVSRQYVANPSVTDLLTDQL